MRIRMRRAQVLARAASVFATPEPDGPALLRGTSEEATVAALGAIEVVCGGGASGSGSGGVGSAGGGGAGPDGGAVLARALSRASSHAYALAAAIAVADEGRSRALSLAAIAAARAAVAGLGDGAAVARVLPGVVAAMAGVALGDFKRGSAVIGAATDCLGAVVSLAMSDVSLAARPPPGGLDPRDATWLAIASERVGGALARVATTLRADPHAGVRAAAGRLAAGVACSCGRALGAAAGPALAEALVVLCEDDVQEVAAPAAAALREAAARPAATAAEAVARQRLLVALEGRARSALRALPRVARSLDDAALCAALRLLCGFVASRGPGGLTAYLDVPGEPARLCVALRATFALDTSPARSSVMDVGGADGGGYLRKRFRYLGDGSAALASAQRLVRLLGAAGDALSLAQLFLASLPRGGGARGAADCAAVVVVNELLVGASSSARDGGGAEDAAAVVADIVLSEYLSAELWGPEGGGAEAGGPAVTVVDAPVTAGAFRALLIEGVGNAAAAMGRDFDVQLTRALYPCLEALGDADAAVRQVCARACGAWVCSAS